MRILHVVTGLGCGGLERLVGHLSLWLQEKGHEVRIAYLSEEADLVPDFINKGLTVHYSPEHTWLSRLYPRSLVGLMRNFRPDIVHCHDSAWLKTSAACRWVKVPYLYTLHNFLGDWLKQHRLWLAWAARSTAFCVGVAPGIENLFVDILGAPAHKTRYVPNGVPDIYFACPPAPDWGVHIPPGSVLVGMVARFDEKQKDQPTLLRAMARIIKRLPQAHLLLIGDGPTRANAEGLAVEMGIEHNVHFLGIRNDVEVLIHHLDVFVLSSRFEGQPLVILEAMSAGRPIVATAVGGIPELLANGDCGLLVPPCDDEAMAAAIVELLEDQAKAAKLSRQARERFLQEYTMERMGERYLGLYDSALRFRRRKE